MAGEFDYGDVRELYEGARSVRINLCVFEGNADIPGEIAPLARVLWKHIPEMARREGVQIEEHREGYPAGIVSPDKRMVDSIAADMAASRDLVGWMPSSSAESRAMFAQGADNSMNAFLDRFARDKGFTRDDVLSRERDAAAGMRQAAAPEVGRDAQSGGAPVDAAISDTARILRGIVPQGAPRMSPVIAAQLSGHLAR